MKQTKFWLIIFVVAIPAFLLARQFWPFSPGVELEASQFFTIVTALESLFLGLGAAFVVATLSQGRFVKKWKTVDWATFLSIAWILISGYPHDNSHITHETDVQGLIFIEVFFHGTLALAALIVAYYFLKKQNPK